jgi:hypothetical protein
MVSLPFVGCNGGARVPEILRIESWGEWYANTQLIHNYQFILVSCDALPVPTGIFFVVDQNHIY